MPVTQQTFLLRERGGRVELHPVFGLNHTGGESECSRLNFRDDGWRYCAYTGIFVDREEARLFAQLRSKGMCCERAMKQIRVARSH